MTYHNDYLDSIEVGREHSGSLNANILVYYCLKRQQYSGWLYHGNVNFYDLSKAGDELLLGSN